MRRANGTGSIIKRKGLRKPYLVRVSIGYKDGKLARKTLGYYETKKEAELSLAQYNLDGKIKQKAHKLSFFYEKLISNKEREDKSLNTLKMYKAAWKKMEYHHNIEVDKLTTDTMQLVIDSLIEEDIGYSTCNKVKLLYKQLLNLAMEMDDVDKNYAEYLSLPKKPKSDKTIYSDKDISKIAQHALENKVLSSVMIMIGTGLRIGEFLSLTRFNVDLEKRIVIAGSKTEKGTGRHIPIHNLILPYFKKLCDDSKDGKLLNYSYTGFRKNYFKELKSIGVEPLPTHHMRKTFSSLAARADMNKIFLQDIMGHEDLSTTSKYYIHNNDADLVSAIDNIRLF